MVLDILTGAESDRFSIRAIYHPVRDKFNPLSCRRAASAEVWAAIAPVNSPRPAGLGKYPIATIPVLHYSESPINAFNRDIDENCAPAWPQNNIGHPVTASR